MFALRLMLSRHGWTLAFIAVLLVHLSVALLGWADTASVETDFRQAQTAISTHFIQQEGDYSLAYPTPILGKPWSIPMEFPLYQWTVAKLVTWFDWPLVSTGRGVSLACFYLTLPAWFLLLGGAGLPPPRRWGVLIIVLGSPVYLHHSRSFLIESTALMFASWHAFFVTETLRRRRWPWLLAAAVSGIAAALAKITTWAAVLLPCACFGAWLLFRPGPTTGREKSRLVSWGLGAVLPALAAGWWWVRTADLIKGMNPAADFLDSDRMASFNFGTLALRGSADLWTTLYTRWTSVLLPGTALAFILIAGLGLGGRWRALTGLALAGFLGSQLLFPYLYYAHDYYFFANGFMLAAALGLAGCHVLDQARLPGWIKVAAWSCLLATGGDLYTRNFLPRQREVLTAPSGLTQAIQGLTRPDEMLVVLGEDWSAMTPFAARRRALMVPAGRETDEGWWQASLQQLATEHIALLLVTDQARSLPGVVERRVRELGLHPQPVFTYQGRTDAYVHKAVLHRALATLRGAAFDGIETPALVPVPAGERQFSWPHDRAAFLVTTPFPVRYNTPYGAPPWQEHEDTPVFIAHAPTRLEFELPAEAREMRLAFGMIADSYARYSSDGAEIIVELAASGAPVRELWRRPLMPRERPEDRLRLQATIPLPSGVTGRVILRTHPGSKQNIDYDWVYFSEIDLR